MTMPHTALEVRHSHPSGTFMASGLTGPMATFRRSIGARRIRKGIAIAALICAAIGCSTVPQTSESTLARIRSLEVQPAPAVLAGQQRLIFPEKAQCRGVCVQALATGGYHVVMRVGDQIRLRRRKVGEACNPDVTKEDGTLFLYHGYIGVCASSEPVDMPTEGVVIREYELRNGKVVADAEVTDIGNGKEIATGTISDSIGRLAAWIPDFTGKLYDISLRRGGVEQLVGRRFAGVISSPQNGKAANEHDLAITVGGDFQATAFYARILGLPDDRPHRPGSESLESLLQAFDRHMMQTSPGHDNPRGHPGLLLAVAFGQLAATATVDEMPIVEERIERYIALDLPLFAHAALNAIYKDGAFDAATVEPALLRLLDSRNPGVVAVTYRKAGYQFHMHDRPRILGKVMEIPFRSELFAQASGLTIGLFRPPLPNPEAGYDTAYRQRAIDYLLAADEMSTEQCSVLLDIAALGADRDAARAQAFEGLLHTKPPVFAACAELARPSFRRGLIGEIAPNDSQTILLRDRAELISDGALRDYWRRFLSSPRARALSDEYMLALVERRLNAARPATDDAKNAIMSLEWLHEYLRR